MEQLHACADDQKRSAYIAERAEFVKALTGEQAGNFSQQRQKKPSGDAPKYSPETDLKPSEMFV